VFIVIEILKDGHGISPKQDEAPNAVVIFRPSERIDGNGSRKDVISLNWKRPFYFLAGQTGAGYSSK